VKKQTDRLGDGLELLAYVFLTNNREDDGVEHTLDEFAQSIKHVASGLCVKHEPLCESRKYVFDRSLDCIPIHFEISFHLIKKELPVSRSYSMHYNNSTVGSIYISVLEI